MNAHHEFSFSAPECPGCGAELRGLTGLSEHARPPRAGDLCVCASCGEVLVFDAFLDLRELDCATLEAMSPAGRELAAGLLLCLAETLYS